MPGSISSYLQSRVDFSSLLWSGWEDSLPLLGMGHAVTPASFWQGWNQGPFPPRASPPEPVWWQMAQEEAAAKSKWYTEGWSQGDLLLPQEPSQWWGVTMPTKSWVPDQNLLPKQHSKRSSSLTLIPLNRVSGLDFQMKTWILKAICRGLWKQTLKCFHIWKPNPAASLKNSRHVGRQRSCRSREASC